MVNWAVWLSEEANSIITGRHFWKARGYMSKYSNVIQNILIYKDIDPTIEDLAGIQQMDIDVPEIKKWIAEERNSTNIKEPIDFDPKNYLK